jgi:hypothetical protein
MEENLYRRIYISTTATDRAKMTSGTLYISLTRKVPQRVSLAPIGGGKATLKPQGQGEWVLSHTEPTVRNNPQEIDTWDIAERLSGVIERGIFNYKKVIDGRKQYNLWLCWLHTPVPRKKASKKDITIKQEIKQ